VTAPAEAVRTRSRRRFFCNKSSLAQVNDLEPR
jgi:hypothetical protein